MRPRTGTLSTGRIQIPALGGSTILRVAQVVSNGIMVRLLSRVVHLWHWLVGGSGWIVKKSLRMNQKERNGEKEKERGTNISAVTYRIGQQRILFRRDITRKDVWVSMGAFIPYRPALRTDSHRS